MEMQQGKENADAGGDARGSAQEDERLHTIQYTLCMICDGAKTQSDARAAHSVKSPRGHQLIARHQLEKQYDKPRNRRFEGRAEV